MITKINAELSQVMYGVGRASDCLKLEIARSLKVDVKKEGALHQLLSNEAMFNALVDAIASMYWNKRDPLYNEEEYLLDTMLPYAATCETAVVHQAKGELMSLLAESFGICLSHFDVLPSSQQIDIHCYFAKD